MERERLAEAEVIEAALARGDLRPERVQTLQREVARRRAAGEDVTLLRLVGAELRPDQLAELRVIYERALSAGGQPARAAETPPTQLDPGPLPRLPRPGERLGPCEVLAELGRGGMGAVYRARDALGREVALKVCLAQGSRGETRFETEAAAAAKLRHPSVVRVHSFGREDGLAYLVMELVEGVDLSARLEAGPCAEAEAIQIGLQLAEALAHAHAAGVVHRDLKPSNVLLDRAGRARLTDFGMARLLVERERLTRTGELVGTPAFMAPEQARGDAKASGPATDVYALGATLYASLSGHAPFPDEPVFALLVAIGEREPAPLLEQRPELEPALARLISACMRKDAARRPAADDVARALRALARGEPQASERLLAPSPGAPRRWRRAALLAALALLALPGAWLASGSPPAADPLPADELAQAAPALAPEGPLAFRLDAAGRFALPVEVEARAPHLRVVLREGLRQGWRLRVWPAQGERLEPAPWRVWGEGAGGELRVSPGGPLPFPAGPYLVEVLGPPGGAGVLEVRASAEPAPLEAQIPRLELADCFSDPQRAAAVAELCARMERLARAPVSEVRPLVEEVVEHVRREPNPRARTFLLQLRILGRPLLTSSAWIPSALQAETQQAPEDPLVKLLVAGFHARTRRPRKVFADLEALRAAWPQEALLYSYELAACRHLLGFERDPGETELLEARALAAARRVLGLSPEAPAGVVALRLEAERYPDHPEALARYVRGAVHLLLEGRYFPRKVPAVKALAELLEERAARAEARLFLDLSERVPVSLDPHSQGLGAESAQTALEFELARGRILALADPSAVRARLQRLRALVGEDEGLRRRLSAGAARLDPR